MSGRDDGSRRRMSGRPDGVPLGRAFLIASGMANDPLRDAVDVVARVHGDGELPTIPVVWDTSLDVRARFVVRDGLPSAIAVDPAIQDSRIALIHEIGHFLDFASIDQFGAYASAASPITERWLATVIRSTTYELLLAAIDTALTQVLPTERRWRDQIEALGSASELWARTYTQYVIRRSGQPGVAAAFAAERVGTVAGFRFPLHWAEDEFEPIDHEIERLFRSLRWRRR
jgi:hypothetical protein